MAISAKTDGVISWFRENRILPTDAIYVNFHFLNKSEFFGQPTRIIRPNDSEFRLMRYTVDLMLVTDRLIGVEFISDDYYPFGVHPIYKSISGNERVYNNFFDEMWVCCTPKSFDTAHKKLPENVGIFVLNKDGSMFVSRIANEKECLPYNSEHTRSIDLANHLTKKEMRSLCSEHNVEVRSVYNKELLSRYMIDIPYSSLVSAVANRLKKRFHNSAQLQKNVYF